MSLPRVVQTTTINKNRPAMKIPKRDGFELSSRPKKSPSLPKSVLSIKRNLKEKASSKNF